MQFHPEPTLAMLDGWTHALGHVMQANGVDPERTRELARQRVPEWHERSAELGRRFAEVVARPPSRLLERGGEAREQRDRLASSCSRCWSMIRSMPASR